MTDEELEAARALVDAATPGPWFFGYSRVCSRPLSREYDRIEQTFPDDIDDEDPRWESLPDPDVCYVTPSYGDTATGQRVADAEFIAAARTLVPALLSEIATMRPVVEAAITAADDHWRYEGLLWRAVEAYRASRKEQP